MIERTGQYYQLICDHCEHTVENLESFDEAVQYKKKRGWKSLKGRSSWFEFCPRCSNPEIMQGYRRK